MATQTPSVSTNAPLMHPVQVPFARPLEQLLATQIEPTRRVPLVQLIVDVLTLQAPFSRIRVELAQVVQAPVKASKSPQVSLTG